MNILWVKAHPEPKSLNSFLAEEGQRALVEAGHHVETSDLYAMNWNPVVDSASYNHDRTQRFHVASAAQQAFDTGRLPDDIRIEQDKISRADTLVIQFPMWWFGMPAMLRGWFERVWHLGFAYGLRGPDGEWRGYGDGLLAGKQAIVVTTLGGPAWFYGERGIHGDVDHLLFPLQHGILFYAGARVLPPVVFTGADRFTDDAGREAADRLKVRLLSLPETEPIAYRTQDSGDYDDNLVLRDEVAPGRTGLGVHVA